MDVTLPNGQVIRGVPDGTPKDVIMQKAISAGIAVESDFLPNGGESEPQAEYAGAGLGIPSDGGAVPTSDQSNGSGSGFLGYGADVVLEAMAAVNRGAVELADLPATLANAVLQVAGSDMRVPKIGEQEAVQQGIKGGFMEPGLAREAVRFYGEAAAPGVPIGKMSQADELVDIGSDVSTQARRATEFSETEKLPLMTTDVAQPKTFAGKSAQALGEKIPITGTGAPRAAQQEARETIVEEFSRRFGDYDPADVYKSLQQKRSLVATAAGNRRQAIVDQVSDVVAVDKVVKSIDDEIAKLTKTPTGVMKQTADTSTVDQLQRFRDDLVADPSFKNLEELRTAFRETVRGDRPVMPKGSDASVSRVYRAMTDDMDDAVRDSLGTDQLKKWKEANAIFFNEAQKVKKTRLKNVLDKGEVTPEVVENMLFSRKPSEVKALFDSLTTTGKQSARAGLVSKAFEQSAGSPDRFANNLRKMSSQFGIAFKGKDKEFVDGLQAYLNATREAGQAGVRTKSGQELYQFGIPAGVAADITATGGMGTAGAGMFGLLARAYESRPVRNAMIRLAQANGPAQDIALEDASKILSAVAAQQISPDDVE